MEILFKNVKIVDGQGTPAYVGNVGVSNGKLYLSNLPEKAELVIDGSGKVLAPGFIDAHSHNDWFALRGEPVKYFAPFIKFIIIYF